MSKELRLIKEDFCRLNKIPVETNIEVVYQERNPKTGNYIFAMIGGGTLGARYEQERIDLSLYTGYKSLQLEAETQYNTSGLNKDSVASWFNRWINLNMLPSDIGQLIIRNDSVTVVSSSNSMRFKHSFSMSFK